MKSPSTQRSLCHFICGCLAAAALSAPALAQRTGGGHVAGGVGHFGGYHGGFAGYRGGYGWHGGYGWGGGYGWRGGGYGFYGPWGWGGLGLGLYFASLPVYYSTLWWDGVPYYYSDNTYYRWNGTVSQYETVSPPPELAQQGAAPTSAAADIIAYPKNGQSQEQQGTDRYQCHRWAADKTGFDPTQLSSAPAPGRRSDYIRAQTACLEGRGYSIK